MKNIFQKILILELIGLSYYNTLLEARDTISNIDYRLESKTLTCNGCILGKDETISGYNLIDKSLFHNKTEQKHFNIVFNKVRYE